MKCHITAVGVARFGRRSESLVDLLAEAGEEALRGVGRKTVDLLVIGSMAAATLGQTENLSSRLVERLGLEATSAFRVEAASASGAAAFYAASLGIQSGHHQRALVVAGEKMTDRPTAEVTTTLARSLAPSEASSGATMPGLAALVSQLYLARHGIGERAMDLVSVQARECSRQNPGAQFRTPVREEEVASSRMIAPPLRLLHCSPISDGAAALVLEAGVGPSGVLGIGQGIDRISLVDRDDLATFRATRLAAKAAYEHARLTRKEIDFAEVHDAFAPFAFLNLEDLGLCRAGEAPSWFAEGRTGPTGSFPVNPSGGLIGRGHPVGASGLVQIAEVARQQLGLAGPLEVPRRRIGLAQSIGGLGTHNFVTILGPTSRGSA